MIFATVGTHGQPFPRMLAALAELEGEVIVQYGHNPPPEGFAEAHAFLPFDGFLALVDRAEAVVTHAGVGSILTARAAGHTPVVIPRQARLGEHVDDHQADLTRSLEERGEVVALWEATGLADALARALPRRAGREIEEGPLHRAVREELLR